MRSVTLYPRAIYFTPKSARSMKNFTSPKSMAWTKPIPTTRSNLLITPRRRYYVKRFSSLLRVIDDDDDDNAWQEYEWTNELALVVLLLLPLYIVLVSLCTLALVLRFTLRCEPCSVWRARHTLYLRNYDYGWWCARDECCSFSALSRCNLCWCAMCLSSTLNVYFAAQSQGWSCKVVEDIAFASGTLLL